MKHIFLSREINKCIRSQTGLFWQYRTDSFVKSRHPSLILFYATVCSISLLFLVPLLILKENATYCSQSVYSTLSTDYIAIFVRNNELLVQIVEIIDEVMSIMLICTLMARFWLLYYDYCFGLASVNKMWRLSINATERNFWIDYRKTFGNVCFAMFIVILFNLMIFIVYLSITLLMEKENKNKDNLNSFIVVKILTKLLVTSGSILSVFSIISKISKIFDTFQIKKEIKQLLILLIIFSTAILVNEIILDAFFIENGTNNSILSFKDIDFLLDVTFYAIMTYIQV